MYQDVIIAGFGGQGVMLIGNVLAYAAMEQGLNVTYMPVYGVEMRGGTANCTVVISDEEIGSPIIFYPKSLVIMNQPSLMKFQPRLVKDGLLIVNSSIVDESLVDKDKYNVLMVPVNNIADKLGDIRMANMVALGVWVGATRALDLGIVTNAMEKNMSNLKKQVIENNKKALLEGYKIGTENLV
ncbi:2-oxoacid:acceptor oxidoreductase family protein [Desulfothermus okinawensis JCM 13304]